ncbi:MAG: maleylpyruvate isomerase N-terminal domain-containing protein [Chloroflexota bacterium]
MTLDRSFVALNRAATARMRDLVARLTDDDYIHPVGEHWTVAVALAHIAFWERRVQAVLDATEQAGKFSAPTIDVVVNDISLPLWLAIPPREAARIAIASAETLDQRLESFSPELLEQVAEYNIRYVERGRHRGEHMDEIDQALKA